MYTKNAQTEILSTQQISEATCFSFVNVNRSVAILFLSWHKLKDLLKLKSKLMQFQKRKKSHLMVIMAEMNENL